MAIQCINDKLNNNKLLSKIKTEKKRIYNLLTKSDIPYFPSETNYILINPTKEKQQIMKDFEKDNIILEESDLNYNDYWSLPLSTPKINNKIMNSIITIY